MDFTPEERAALRIVQEDLPDSLTPYADIAAVAGLDEAKLIAFLARLRDEGVIRRFGASIKHQRAGWAHNAMVAWKATPEQAERAGAAAAEHQRVSHCYFRPSSAPDWPYTFYTMIHGKSPEDCLGTVQELRACTGLEEYMVLESLKELKKISPTYFGENI